MVFFLLLYVYDTKPSFLSLMLLFFLALAWYRSIKNPHKGVRLVNNGLIIFIMVKYLITLLDIREDYHMAEKPDFQTSLALRIFSKNSYNYRVVH